MSKSRSGRSNGITTTTTGSTNTITINGSNNTTA